MTTIKFNKKYYKPILKGEKTQTMRIARKRLEVGEGETVTAVFPGLTETLTLQINRVGYKQFKSVNIEDVELEGYASLADLKNDLIKIYPLITRFDRLYYYRFEVIK